MTDKINSTSEAPSAFSFANSQRIYVRGSQDSINVPFREVHLNPTRTSGGQADQNPPVRIYDSSGPWGDIESNAEVHDGIAAIRRRWITERADV
ncbi:MAG TPA: phosphomethylpyrimidine synthase, partial [Blastocatellia bacterium]|nr:phosphomethylpyrimidine synthase [Blastocatellia bacterium]